MERIGHYEVEKELGRGAMGVVYLAHDPRVRRRLAVKTYELPPGIDEREAREFQARFIREAQSAGALNHPSIVTIYDVAQDTAKGATYIAMEYVPGSSLKEFLRSVGRMEPARVVDLGVTLSEALHVAHGTGVVHRDIKPGNILIRSSDGLFKLADFGIARFAGSDLTDEGMTLGSPAYMSPEQIRSLDVDGRSDLFSLAGVLYEALTGRRPFQGKDLAALAYAVVHDEVRPLREIVPDLPVSLETFFGRAMAKDPDARYADGRSFAAALRLAWQRRHLKAPAPPRQAAPAASESAAAADGEANGATDSGAGTALGESTSGSYKPRAPRQFLQRSHMEQTLSNLDIIPLRTGRTRARDGAPEKTASRWADASDERPWREPLLSRMAPSRTSWVRLLLLVVLAAGGLATWSTWQNLPQPDPGSVILDVTSRIDGAMFRIFSDGELIYAGGAPGDDAGGGPGKGKHPSVTIEPGEHVFLVHVVPKGSKRSYQEQVKANVHPGESHRLRVVSGSREDPIPVVRFD